MLNTLSFKSSFFVYLCDFNKYYGMILNVKVFQ